MKKVVKVLLPVLLLFNSPVKSQDLMDMLGDPNKETTDYTTATFKTTRLVTGQSVENPANGVLVFIISHRFGKLNDGAYNFFGLDQGTMRLGLEYGVTDRLAVGIGRSTLEKTFDGFAKYKILRQSTGKRNMPVTLSYFGSITVNSLKWQYPERKNYFSSRLAFVNQIMVARKFNGRFSAQITPTHIHKNLVPTVNDKNDVFSLGMGGRYKFTNRASVNVEYFYTPTGQFTQDYANCLSVGFDVETGGHVFQLIFTNSQAMFERGFTTETTGKWNKGDIFFGFNITRVFTIKKPKI